MQYSVPVLIPVACTGLVVGMATPGLVPTVLAVGPGPCRAASPVPASGTVLLSLLLLGYPHLVVIFGYCTRKAAIAVVVGQGGDVGPP